MFHEASVIASANSSTKNYCELGDVMKWRVIFGAFALISTAARAEPGPTVSHLMDDPVSMLDLGILRMTQALESNLEAPVGFIIVAGYKFAEYQWEKNRIVVSAAFAATSESSRADDWMCNYSLRNIAHAVSLFTAPELRRNAELSMESYFSHEGFKRSSEPEGLGSKLLAIVHLESRVVPWGETIFDHIDPDCEADWTDYKFVP